MPNKQTKSNLHKALAMEIAVMHLTLVLFLTVGCTDNPIGPVTSTNAIDNAPAIVAGAVPSEQEKSRLLAAKEELFKRLSGRLMTVMSEGGPAAAIEVCQVEAKSMAIEVGKETNVNIGRTGVRLRNTSNQPPSWAQKLVDDRTETPVFARLSNEHSVALLPIKLQAQCLMCHGPSDSLAIDVKQKLAKLYPQDQATGFSEGELRGWFWVETLD
ncbi:MAG: DUF3365 domain-containing protein [Pirellula sp.]|jgi:hypothetical protein|nr:DUF3365 domain-containing protein [Pirellula sp.]